MKCGEASSALAVAVCISANVMPLQVSLVGRRALVLDAVVQACGLRWLLISSMRKRRLLTDGTLKTAAPKTAD